LGQIGLIEKERVSIKNLMSGCGDEFPSQRAFRAGEFEAVS
jgi:hypothetical protein